jgi:hypothetical protein
MEILNKQDPEKKRLMDEANRHKEMLAEDVRLVSERTEKIVTNALIVGGTLAIAYLIVRQLSGGKSKKKKTNAIRLVAQPPKESTGATEPETDDYDNSILNQIGNKIASEATVFLLNLAKEKLSEYLLSRKEKSNEDH